MQTGKNVKIKIAVLILLLAVLTVLLTEKLKEGYLPEEYSDTYVSVDEVREELRLQCPMTVWKKLTAGFRKGRR